MAEEMMLMLIRDSCNMFISLYLGGRCGEEIDVH